MIPFLTFAKKLKQLNMKKRTLSIMAFSALFAFATLTSCGGGTQQEETSQEETTTNETTIDEAPQEEVVAEETLSETQQAGKDLFKTNACVACHQEDRKIVGPALKDIAIGYADNTEGLVAFLAGKGESIIDPSQAAVMSPQIETTKAMTDEERNAIADYIMSVK